MWARAAEKNWWAGQSIEVCSFQNFPLNREWCLCYRKVALSSGYRNIEIEVRRFSSLHGMKFRPGGWSLTAKSRLLNWELLVSIRICIIAAIFSKAIGKSFFIDPTFQYKLEVYFAINVRLITHFADIETEMDSVLLLSILLWCTLKNC